MITLPATGYVGLSVGGVEVAGNDYERQAVLFTHTVDGISVANIDGIVWPLAYPYGWGLISTVQLYDALGWVIEASDQIAQRRLTSAAGAYERNHFARLHLEADVVQHRRGRACIRE